MNSKILVTGSSGMIGSALVPALEKSGFVVIALDRVEPTFTKPSHFLQHDLCNPLSRETCSSLENVDLIIHLAANARVYELVENPQKAMDNVQTTHNIFEFARKEGIKRIMFASSREVYGNGVSLPVSESAGSQRNCESSYGASKLFGESYCHAYSRCYGIDAQILRFSNVYGKYDFSDRFIPKVIRQLNRGEKVMIYGRNKLLDFTFLDDVVSAVLYLVCSWPPPATQGKEWNIASGKAYSLFYVANKLKTLIGSPSQIDFQESHVGEVVQFEADISKIKEKGWTPSTTLESGLDQAVEYYLKIKE